MKCFQVKVLYVGNMMLRTTTASLKKVVCEVVEPKDVTRVCKLTDYAFVHFTTRQAAQLALIRLNGKCSINFPKQKLYNYRRT